VQEQNSEDPTGVSSNHDGGPGDTRSRARQRKANAAIQLRLAGASYAEVAMTLGYPTPRTALVAVEKALERQLSYDDREAMRRMAGARLERLLRGVWSKAVDPEHPEHLFAVTKAKELIDRYAKLYGLDAPTEVVVHNPTQTEIEQWVATVLAARALPVAEYDIIEGEVEDDAVQA
jgi:hypothetical protein